MIDPSLVCILMATLERDLLLRRAMDSIAQTAPKCCIVVATDPHDERSYERARKYPNTIVVTTAKSYQGCAGAWNTALAAAPAGMQAFVMGADDVVFHPGWLDQALETLHQMGDSGVVGFNDLRVTIGVYWWSAHYIVTRDFLIQHMGGVFAPPCYAGDYVDTETCAKAIKLGKFRKNPLAHVEHRWLGGPKGDKTYQRAWERRLKCKAEYKRREAAGFPIEWEPIIS